MHRISIGLGALLCAVALVASTHMPALAQGVGVEDKAAGFTGDGAVSSGVAIVTTSTTGRPVLRGLTVHSTTAGLVTIRKGGPSGTAVGYLYVDDDVSNVKLTAEDLGGGLAGDRGGSLWLTIASGTLSGVARYRHE